MPTVDFTCAFCGLACDDLKVHVRTDAGAVTNDRALSVVSNGCAHSARALEKLSSVAQVSPRVRGDAVPLQQAIAAAADMLRASHQPVLAGLGTDVAGARAVMRLARRCGAVTDHMNFGAKMRNVLVTQDRGWITTTFAEVKQRADFVLIVGGDPAQRFPRFYERLVEQTGGLFGEISPAREVVLLGPAAAPMLKNARATALPCAQDALAEVLGVLRMLVSAHPASDRLPEIGSIGLAMLNELAAKLKAAKYGVVVWAAADFDFPHAELTIQRLAELVKDLNFFTRYAALPLGGNDGDLSMNQVHVWQSGFALRSDFGRGHADYDPYANGAQALLARGEADALVWISSFSEARLPPETQVPTIVLGRADMHFEREPEVFIPVGTPGVDHDGHFVRSDKVVTMRLRKLRESSLPSVAQVVDELDAALAASDALRQV